jgi:hypothetical protein
LERGPEREAKVSRAVGQFLTNHTEKMTYREWSAVSNAVMI